MLSFQAFFLQILCHNVTFLSCRGNAILVGGELNSLEQGAKKVTFTACHSGKL